MTPAVELLGHLGDTGTGCGYDDGEQFFLPFRGFSVAERLMLDRYRQRLM